MTDPQQQPPQPPSRPVYYGPAKGAPQAPDSTVHKAAVSTVTVLLTLLAIVVALCVGVPLFFALIGAVTGD